MYQLELLKIYTMLGLNVMIYVTIGYGLIKTAFCFLNR